MNGERPGCPCGGCDGTAGAGGLGRAAPGVEEGEG